MTDYTYFEDVVVGMMRENGPVAVTAAEIIEFAKKYDPQPMHTDPEAAKGITGGLIASGWMTASLTMRMLITAPGYRPAPGTLGLGFDSLQWPRPVRPGDVLRIQMEAIVARESGSRPGWGVITNRVTTLNQNDERVQLMDTSAIIPMRHQK